MAAQVARLRDPSRRERLSVLTGSAWHAVGPAAVFAIARVSAPDLDQWPVFVLALGAQFGLDAASTWIRNGYGLGVPVPRLRRALRFTFLADILLAPIGLAAAVATPGSAAALLYLMPPVLLLGMLQRDRRQQINRTLMLGDAFAEATDRARRDVLTGLPNRLAWEEAIARCADTTLPLAVVFADVDGLKAANDRFGHHMGDALLIAVADLVSGAKPAGNDAIVARLGGDEFGILLIREQALRAGRGGSHAPVQIAGRPPVGETIAVSASVGVGMAARGADLSSALAEADRAVYEDKRGRGLNRG